MRPRLSPGPGAGAAADRLAYLPTTANGCRCEPAHAEPGPALAGISTKSGTRSLLPPQSRPWLPHTGGVPYRPCPGKSADPRLTGRPSPNGTAATWLVSRRCPGEALRGCSMRSDGGRRGPDVGGAV